MKTESNTYHWWHKAIIYQIYPRSFQDSNNDGVGDLQGIIQRLDYLKWLGADAIWLSPIFPSPMADFGYDISDYQDIHPLFGSLQDFDELLARVHGLGMKLILDLVPNHTSDQHPWFLESRSSTDNPKRNWYLWEDARPDGSVPNNWLSVFGGNAWEWDEKTGQYYYHAFLKEQPDLNWRNPEVQEAMLNMMRFWLDKGVDGFRVDVMWYMIKDLQLRDNPVNPDYQPQRPTCEQLIDVYSTDQPEVHDLAKMMRKVLDEYEERMMIAELYLPIDQLMTYYGKDQDEAHLPFNFMLLSLPWEPQKIAASIEEYEAALPAEGWPNWVLANHDRPRTPSRLGLQQAKVAAMLLLTLRGTPTIYYGEEIGMHDVPIPQNEVQDPQGLNMPDKNLSRDPCRTPMQWSPEENAGFTKARPWLRVDAAFARENVEVQQSDPYAMLSLYKQLIALRKNEPSLSVGNYELVAADPQLLAYTRKAQNEQTFLILLNLSHRPCYFKQQDLKGRIEISTTPELEGTAVDNTVCLSGDEGIIIRLS